MIFQAVLEIHDELAAQIQNSTEAVEYIDGVSTIAEDDDEKSTLTSIAEEKIEENEQDKEEEEEVQIDTFRVIGIRRSPGECLVTLVLFMFTLSAVYSQLTRGWPVNEIFIF